MYQLSYFGNVQLSNANSFPICSSTSLTQFEKYQSHDIIVPENKGRTPHSPYGIPNLFLSPNKLRVENTSLQRNESHF